MSPISRLDRRSHPKRILRLVLVYFLDILAFAFSAFLAFELRFDGVLPIRYLHPMESAAFVWVVTKIVAFIICKVPKGHWRHTSAYDVVRIVMANSLGSMGGGLVLFLALGLWGIPHSLYVLDWLISCFLTLGTRVVFRVVITAQRSNRDKGERTKTLIYGAGAAGLALVLELWQNRSLMCDVVGLIDDDPQKADLVLHGKRVLGTGEFLGALARKHSVKRVLIAIPSATAQQMVRIFKLILDAEVEYKMIPSLGELIQGKQLDQQIREVSVEDLLGRKPVQLDQNRIRERLEGKVVMVTFIFSSIIIIFLLFSKI